MAKLPSTVTLAWLLFLVTLAARSCSARTIGKPTHHHHHRHHRKITFLMQDVLNVTNPSPRPATTKFTSGHQLPFHKPVGLFPPNGGIPIPESETTTPVAGVSTQTILDIPNLGLYFPARAALQEMEFGTVTNIYEDLYRGSGHGSPVVVGKAEGVYVASSENGTSHMMAMTAAFANREFKDGLRLLGVHRTDVAESHVAVIGGMGKYDGANGYATVKAGAGEEQGGKMLLLFTVYLSQ